jgi:hypothetical protein
MQISLDKNRSQYRNINYIHFYLFPSNNSNYNLENIFSNSLLCSN